MPDPVLVRVTHRYNVSVERVFDAWLTPAQAARFLFATRTGNVLQCQIKPEVGGGFTVTDRRPIGDGEESFFDAEHRGTYVEIDRPSRLVFDFGVEPFLSPPTRVTLDFVPMGISICELVLTHQLGEGAEARAYAERTRQGWTRMLEQLEKILSTRSWGFKTVA
ncbi:hypothetical protein GCM10027034_42560 [Ramlibacter solisilvae]|uniref:Activator of Hsp90 ATPase homologue 1/2-like C-terminal domain-containing protein n=1 Tax=Ramlibacter tataouinensis TaxID=94132 RepID=A0A127JYS7_9BURK|nr:SRPBCC domain-containing protein [Ramlibacter tataouinensis]AMO23262.1 hypothetical protein UC35_10595 [Ramlibacter tataouinensis]